MISHNGAQAEEKLQYSSSVNISYETPLASYLIFTVQEQWKQTFECQTHIRQSVQWFRCGNALFMASSLYQTEQQRIEMQNERNIMQIQRAAG